jgi:hypothetical protein
MTLSSSEIEELEKVAEAVPDVDHEHFSVAMENFEDAFNPSTALRLIADLKRAREILERLERTMQYHDRISSQVASGAYYRVQDIEPLREEARAFLGDPQ